ncbi:Phosphatidylinositol 3,4,5-trisphosphate 3-phosphatase and dual-specificity protein phosphatase PTEN [Colletotrichum orbiculare MAFF 240422]|uniref:phosphatidylinositol-3,4,5-trisphosphate 3-phosphatase n=1 Tax=Colletotrichum orbiculare (strain 104-T / ATCC 96160 / CBS 514.97 / LARS 414 / MAFF 240422) TaxID=1213857 RepID=N4VLS8_COLOR|nr:Phosphatidylinositol 3,4,5-trisphosphate 3-phosphatase and dual-specificity protein phosphatase PTEN [Colletotrichum orbiculare MAFF 240422]
MASLLRQIVAGPRARHAESDLDLCYVTSNIIATSGPSGSYPQRAYRNPLDRLVTFLDSKHQDNWAIWEFRAEGTGYPDDEVYGRVRHYPWPDHHPPPFRLIPMIMASMRNWLHGGDLEQGDIGVSAADKSGGKKEQKDEQRVVVVHCKAGKGRSGTVSCSYLISECGWKPEEALTRFTERRMRPKFGAGVSIPSQLRTITYVDRWTKGGKKYVDRPIEIVEIHVWGLRSGVKFDVEGFAEEGKKIKVFHTFKKSERVIVEGDAPSGGGAGKMVADLATVGVKPTEKAPEQAPLAEHANTNNTAKDKTDAETEDQANAKPSRSASKKLRNAKTTSLIHNPASSVAPGQKRSETEAKPVAPPNTKEGESSDGEPGGMAVILKPQQPILIPNSDVNISVERRNRTSASMGLTMVTAVAHVWFNVFFEGNGPEQDGKPDASGVFEIEWDAMDGIKGSSRKGSRAFDKISVVWRVADSHRAADGGDEVGPVEGDAIREPSVGSPVPQMKPADWKGNNKEDPLAEKHLGLRKESPDSADVSRASSVKDQVVKDGNETDSLEGVKTSGPYGEEQLDAEEVNAKHVAKTAEQSPDQSIEPGPEFLDAPDTASGTTTQGSTEVKK